MIAAVRPGIIFLRVDFRVPDGPDGAPVQPAEVYDQIRRNVPNIAINLFWLKDQRLEWLTFVVGQRLDSRLHFVLERFVLSLRNDPLRLTPLNIEEHTSIVATFTPDFRLAPVHVQLFKRRDRKSTRLNSSHRCISYAVFCLK